MRLRFMRILIEDDEDARQMLVPSVDEAPLDFLVQVFSASEDRSRQIGVVEGDGVSRFTLDHDVGCRRPASLHDQIDVARQLESVAAQDERYDVVLAVRCAGSLDERLHALAARDEREDFLPARWGGRVYLHVNLILVVVCACRRTAGSGAFRKKLRKNRRKRGLCQEGRISCRSLGI